MRVGELLATLGLNRGPFTQGLRSARTEAAQAGRDIKRGLDQGTDAVQKQGRTLVGTGRDWQQFSERVGKAGERITKVGEGFTKFGKFMSVGVTLPILALAKTSVDAASDLTESMSKVDVVFGESGRNVLTWSKNSARAMGLSRQEALEAAGTFGNLFTSMGMAQEASAAMSMDVVQLAADLGSFNNVDPSEMLISLRAGLVGEIEPLRRVGININAVTVEAKAMEMGLVDSTGAVTESGKVQARWALILEQSKNSQGDYARTANDLANAQRTATAEMANAQAELGQHLQPLMLDLVKSAREMAEGFMALPDPMQNMIVKGGILLALLGPIAIGIGGIARAAGGAVTGIAKLTTWITDVGGVTAALSRAMTLLLGPVGLVGAALAAGSVILMGWWNEKQRARQATEEYTAALDEETGALADNYAETVINRLEKEGLLAESEKLGLSVEDVIGAITGENDEWERLRQKLVETRFAHVDVNGVLDETGIAADNLIQKLGFEAAQFDVTRESARRKAEALQAVKDAGLLADEQMEKAAYSAEHLAEQADVTTQETTELEEELSALKQTADNVRTAFDLLNGGMIGIDQASITLQGNLDKLSSELTENGTSLDNTTEKGRRNHSAVLDVIEAIGGHIEALGRDGRTMDEMRGQYDKHIGDFRRVMEQAGFTTEQIDALIDKYNLTPDEVFTAVKAQGVPAAVAEVDRFKTALSGIGTVYATVGGFASMNLRVSGGRVAEGGIVEFADGGLSKIRPGSEAHYAQIAKAGDWRLWAEPETGGEAYIPLSPSKRNRSVAIWQETGKRLGIDPAAIHEFAQGGVVGAGTATATAQFDITELTKMPDFFPAMGWEAMFNVVRARFPWVQLHSGYRPGAITATGNPSWHGKGRAIDITPSMEIFNWMVGAADWLELIFSPAGGRQEYRGRPHYFTGITRGMHWDHIHAALAEGGILGGDGAAMPFASYDQGGWLPPGLSLAHNGTGAPEPVGGGGDGRQVIQHFHVPGQDPMEVAQYSALALRVMA